MPFLSELSGDCTGWLPYFVAPTLTAKEAMRRSIITLLQNWIVDIDRPDAWW